MSAKIQANLDVENENRSVDNMPDVTTPRYYELPGIVGAPLSLVLTSRMDHTDPVLAKYRGAVKTWLNTFANSQYHEYYYGVGETFAQRVTFQTHYIEVVYDPVNHEYYDIDVNIGLGPWVVTQPVDIPLQDSADKSIVDADCDVIRRAVRLCWVKLFAITEALEVVTSAAFHGWNRK